MQSLRAIAGLLALLLILVAPAHADNLVKVRAGALPALPGSAPVARVMALDGRLLALAGPARGCSMRTAPAGKRCHGSRPRDCRHRRAASMAPSCCSLPTTPVRSSAPSAWPWPAPRSWPRR